ncbi:MAG: DUF1697 domain-containing protein [Bacteroidetes bacterium]|nr:DUF1697 domain-containing protein [Bacteroidota bacterium]
MTRYVALLRGINVSGQKIIPMAELKRMFEGMRCSNVSTYIQSGNVIFDSTATSRAKLEASIQKDLSKTLGYHVDVILRTMNAMTTLVSTDPFAGKELAGQSKGYITFIQTEPEKEMVLPFISAKNEITIYGRSGLDLFCLSHPLPNGTWGFPNAIVEKVFSIRATTRNWNTVSTIVKKFAK